MIYRSKLTNEGFKKLEPIDEKFYMCRWEVGVPVALSITVEGKEMCNLNLPCIPSNQECIATPKSLGYDYFLQAVKDEGIFIISKPTEI